MTSRGSDNLGSQAVQGNPLRGLVKRGRISLESREARASSYTPRDITGEAQQSSLTPLLIGDFIACGHHRLRYV